jgi:hypothetical protein
MWKQLVRCVRLFRITHQQWPTLMQTQQCLDGVSKQRYGPQVVFAKLSIKLCLEISETPFASSVLLGIMPDPEVLSAVQMTQMVVPMAFAF